MSRFPTAGHLASWARLCPGNHESAGKRRSTTTGAGATWLRATLQEVAWAAVRSKKSYYRALYHRLKARCGPKKGNNIVDSHGPVTVPSGGGGTDGEDGGDAAGGLA